MFSLKSTTKFLSRSLKPMSSAKSLFSLSRSNFHLLNKAHPLTKHISLARFSTINNPDNTDPKPEKTESGPEKTEPQAEKTAAQPEKSEPQVDKKSTENFEFKAETKKLLDIVTHSLYTDKDVFIRELLSNASDALEKQRYYHLTGKDQSLGDSLHISVRVDEAKRELIIQDSGIGMTKQELVDNLGTIARSGSKKFLEQVTEQGQHDMANIIGQFGVGFYSSFIVADTVEVITRTTQDPPNTGHLWVSDGSGKFEVSTVTDPGFERGTKIILHLKPGVAQFSKKGEIQKIIERYSNFINYPIHLNGEKINLVSAIWMRDKRELKDDDYSKFWEYIANTKVPYKYKLHFVTDAPLSIKSILYIPNTHMEKHGMSQEEMEVHLYSRKVLIKSKCRELLPNWLRFVKGVVDCEDIPLNTSRESYQDSNLILKLRGVLTKRILKLINEEATKNEESYLSWYNDFQFFLKEGLATDNENQDAIMLLTRYNTNFSDKLVTIEDYIKKLKPGQDKIYYILGQSQEACENSPYMEPFRGTDIPVLFLTIHIDEMVFRGLQQFKNYKFVNIETNYEDFAKDIKESAHDVKRGLPEEDVTTFCLWTKNELQPLVQKVQISKRLTDSPAIAVSQWSSGMRQVMSMIDKSQGSELNKNLTFEINPNHELIVKLNSMRKSNPRFASVLLKQLLDNTLISAGILTDVKSFIERINQIMIHAADQDFASKKIEEAQEAHREPESVITNEEVTSSPISNDYKAEIVIDKDGNPQVVQKKKD